MWYVRVVLIVRIVGMQEEDTFLCLTSFFNGMKTYPTLIISTSKMRAAYGGIAPSDPCSP